MFEYGLTAYDTYRRNAALRFLPTDDEEGHERIRKRGGPDAGGVGLRRIWRFGTEVLRYAERSLQSTAGRSGNGYSARNARAVEAETEEIGRASGRDSVCQKVTIRG